MIHNRHFTGTLAIRDNGDGRTLVGPLLPWGVPARVVDQGRGIDLRDSSRTETILDQDSGRGIVLMRLMADRIAFESRPEDGTIVHLQKQLELEDNALLSAL